MQEISASYPICFQGGHNHVMIAAFIAYIAPENDKPKAQLISHRQNA